MFWTIEYSETAQKQLRKLDRQVARRIVDYLDQRIAPSNDPRSLGRALTGPLGDFWRYQVGDYRIICDIQDQALQILVVQLRSRQDIYR